MVLCALGVRVLMDWLLISSRIWVHIVQEAGSVREGRSVFRERAYQVREDACLKKWPKERRQVDVEESQNAESEVLTSMR